ncbi:hypothetical protein ACWOAH_09450 [Vagococcus vulneris]|uniref:Cell division protein FtsX n=1 Tax=Vagococcus vulneris TaxID=1977869 RepID=A0A429ZUI7_9ENTE|nr:hypothetical protein [Vagococcus vulneris]RST97356.1 hypothetical protein CBF37_09750 [Vagococcus vulneris]
MNNKQSFLRHFLLGFLSFVCTVLLSSLAIVMIIEHTLFSSNFLIASAEKSNYYSELSKDIKTNIQDLGMGSGIPKDVIQTPVSQEQIKVDVNSYIKHAFNGAQVLGDKEAFKKNLTTNVTAYAEKRDSTISETEKQNIQKFADTAYANYTEYVEIPFLPAFGQKVQVFKANSLIFKIILISCLVLLLILLWYLLHTWIHRLLRYLSYVFSGSALILGVIPLIILISRIIDHISITSKPLYDLTTSFLKGSLMHFVVVSMVFLVISVVSGLSANRLRNKKIKS